MTLTLLLVAALAAQDSDKPQCKDKTGVAWIHPFTDAQKKAKDSARLLMIKPIAFGTDDAGGW